jgi:hypothetical protein
MVNETLQTIIPILEEYNNNTTITFADAMVVQMALEIIKDGVLEDDPDIKEKSDIIKEALNLVLNITEDAVVVDLEEETEVAPQEEKEPVIQPTIQAPAIAQPQYLYVPVFQTPPNNLTSSVLWFTLPMIIVSLLVIASVIF